MEELNLERSYLHRFSSLHRVNYRARKHACPAEFHFQQTARQWGGINWRMNDIQQVVNGTNMIFVAVRDDNPAHFIHFIP